MLTLDTVTSSPPPAADPSEELEPWRDATGAVCARVYRTDGRFLIHWDGAAVFLFDPSRPSVRAWTLTSAGRETIDGIFARRIQPLLLQATGHLVLHASAASSGGAVVAFTGVSGTGKSTLARALRASGCTQWADDAVVIDAGSRPPRVHALPFADEDGAPGSASPGTSARLHAIALLYRQPGAPATGRITPVRDASALTNVLAHAHVFEPSGTVGLVDDYATLLEAVPVFRITFDHSPEGAGPLAENVAAWMRELEAAG